jgi:hypothetical protein
MIGVTCAALALRPTAPHCAAFPRIFPILLKLYLNELMETAATLISARYRQIHVRAVMELLLRLITVGPLSKRHRGALQTTYRNQRVAVSWNEQTVLLRHQTAVVSYASNGVPAGSRILLGKLTVAHIIKIFRALIVTPNCYCLWTVVLRSVRSCSLVRGYQCIGGIYCHRLQGSRS